MGSTVPKCFMAGVEKHSEVVPIILLLVLSSAKL